MDIALSEALAPVLRDLGTCGAPVPDVRDKQWSNFPGQMTAMLPDTDGTAQGVFAMAADSLPQRIASVADQVHEWAVEALWRGAGIRDQGGTALVLESDITDEQQATDAVAATVAELGRLDTLINNAGVMLLGPAVGAPLPEWQQMVELNVLGLLYCAHAALPHLLRAAEDSPRQVR